MNYCPTQYPRRQFVYKKVLKHCKTVPSTQLQSIFPINKAYLRFEILCSPLSHNFQISMIFATAQKVNVSILINNRKIYLNITQQSDLNFKLNPFGIEGAISSIPNLTTVFKV